MHKPDTFIQHSIAYYKLNFKYSHLKVPSLGVGALFLKARILVFASFPPRFSAMFFLNSTFEGLSHSFSSFSRSAETIL